MGAKKTGGTAGRNKAKNIAMASRMKQEGIDRRTCRCPICHKMVGIAALPLHIAKCS